MSETEVPEEVIAAAEAVEEPQEKTPEASSGVEQEATVETTKEDLGSRLGEVLKDAVDVVANKVGSDYVDRYDWDAKDGEDTWSDDRPPLAILKEHLDGEFARIPKDGKNAEERILKQIDSIGDTELEALGDVCSKKQWLEDVVSDSHMGAYSSAVRFGNFFKDIPPRQRTFSQSEIKNPLPSPYQKLQEEYVLIHDDIQRPRATKESKEQAALMDHFLMKIEALPEYESREEKLGNLETSYEESLQELLSYHETVLGASDVDLIGIRTEAIGVLEDIKTNNKSEAARIGLLTEAVEKIEGQVVEVVTKEILDRFPPKTRTFNLGRSGSVLFNAKNELLRAVKEGGYFRNFSVATREARLPNAHESAFDYLKGLEGQVDDEETKQLLETVLGKMEQKLPEQPAVAA